MEETLQQEKQESEYKNPNEDQGGIRRRLRDRNLLRKKKAEAEEKETNQVESQRKRSRANEKSGRKKRGRPAKTDPLPEISIVQEETAVSQEAPAVVVVSEPVGIISGQTPGSLTHLDSAAGDTLESRPSSILTAPISVSMFGSVQSSTFAPVLTSPDSVIQTSIPVQESTPVPAAVSVPALSRASVPAAALDPLQVASLYTESQGRETLDQVLIEDLGPDEEEDINPSQDKRADEDLIQTPSVTVPEQNKMLSMPTLSSPTLPQEYLPENSF